MSRLMTFEEWTEKENGLSQFRFNQMAAETQDTLLHRYLEYRREQDEEITSNRTNQ